MSLKERFKNAFNVFRSEENQQGQYHPSALALGPSYGTRPDRPRYNYSSERTIVSSIYTRLAIDVASVDMRHVRLDDNNRYLEDMTNSTLQECLTVEANLDQAATAFRMDIATQLFDTGVAAIVPVDTSDNINDTGSFDIYTMRVGEILEWYPKAIKVNLYNEDVGRRVPIVVPKRNVAIVENPLYSVMNEQNSTLKRLVRKLSLLDSVDEATSSGKLDLIIQLPYVIKSDARKKQAEDRKTDIEMQLRGSKYGIAYTDGTEKITQLNRPAENNLLGQIQTLTDQLYAQLGLTPSVFDGSADEATMLNYHNRTVAPILTAITEAMQRSFLTRTARAQRQSIEYFRDPFKLVPVGSIADIADKFTRNEIMSSNELRGVIGIKPSKDPNADKLHNSNMPVNKSTGGEVGSEVTPEDSSDEDLLDETASVIDGILSDLGPEDE